MHCCILLFTGVGLWVSGPIPAAFAVSPRVVGAWRPRHQDSFQQCHGELSSSFVSFTCRVLWPHTLPLHGTVCAEWIVLSNKFFPYFKSKVPAGWCKEVWRWVFLCWHNSYLNFKCGWLPAAKPVSHTRTAFHTQYWDIVGIFLLTVRLDSDKFSILYLICLEGFAFWQVIISGIFWGDWDGGSGNFCLNQSLKEW